MFANKFSCPKWSGTFGAETREYRADGLICCKFLIKLKMELEKAKKVRTAERGWLTRCARDLDKLCAQEVVTVVEIETSLAQFDLRLNKLDDIQSSIETLLESADIEADVFAAADYRENVFKSRVAALLLLDKLKNPEPQINVRLEVDRPKPRPTSLPNVELSQSGLSEDIDQDGDKEEDVESVVSNLSTSTNQRTVKLPKLELPKFSGNVVDWPIFWDNFKAIVHDSDLPPVSKFAYLRALLEGDAKASIQGLSPTAIHYDIACNLLNEQYGRSDKIIFAHIQGLLNLSPPDPKGRLKVPTLWKMQDELLAHVRSLEALGITGDKYGLFLTPVILSRLPQELRMEWAREGEGKESDLQFLLAFLKKELQRRERSDVFKEVSSASDVDKSFVSEKRSSSQCLPFLHYSRFQKEVVLREIVYFAESHICQKNVGIFYVYPCQNAIRPCWKLRCVFVA